MEDTHYCKMCGRPFKPKGRDVTCSSECSLENKRVSRRKSWHKIGKYTDDKYLRYIRQKMRRIKERKLR